MSGRERPPAERRVLLLAPDRPRRRGGAFGPGGGGRGCVLCPCLDALCREAAAGAGAAVVPEEAVQGEGGACLSRFLEAQPVWSDLPVVLLSRGGPSRPPPWRRTWRPRPGQRDRHRAAGAGLHPAQRREDRPAGQGAAVPGARPPGRPGRRPGVAAPERGAAREEGHVVETISQVGRTLAAELDVQKLVQAVTDATTEVTGAAFGAFFYNVTDEQGQSYSLTPCPASPARRSPGSRCRATPTCSRRRSAARAWSAWRT